MVSNPIIEYNHLVLMNTRTTVHGKSAADGCACRNKGFEAVAVQNTIDDISVCLICIQICGNGVKYCFAM